jgi:hypothetical protein
VRTDGEPALAPARRPGGLGQTLRTGSGSFGAKPDANRFAAAKSEPRAAEARSIDSARRATAQESSPAEEPEAKPAKAEPPPPVVPAINRGTRGKKKKSREE